MVGLQVLRESSFIIMNKQQLAAKIWASANQMRSKIEASEYKDYILGFIFYKFLSDKELAYLKREVGEDVDLSETIKEENEPVVQLLQNQLGYFIAYENLFSTWLSMGRDFNVAIVRDALSSFERKVSPNHKKLFDGIFETLQTGLSKLGTTAAEQTKSVRDLAELIQEIPTDGRQDYDVLGFVYEYLISNFAANAGKKAGEFYTPHEVSVMMSDIIAHHLRDNNEIRIYDPTSGSGSLLINIGKSVARHIQNRDNIKYYAQELKQNTYNLTRMNLIMRGINPSNIEVRNGDTLKEDWPYFDESDPQGTYEPLYVDAVVSNPPYSQKWEPKDQENEPRYADFGLAPQGCADYAFLLHDLFHVKPSGIMTIVLPHGVLYRGGSEQQIRSKLVELNHIDAIIGLPEKVFFGTGISTIVMVLKRTTRQDENILFVDASAGYEKDGKNNKLRACDIKKIVDAVTTRTEEPNFSRLVSRDIIRQNEYNLNISRYVDSSPKAEKYDIYATMFGGIPQSELNTLSAYWQAFPSLQNTLFEKNADGYSHLITNDLAQAIRENSDVKKYAEDYTAAFSTLPDFLENTLVQPMLSANIEKTHTAIANDLFRRLQPFTLMNPYQAFEFFSKDWQQIATDLEILQTEGIDAVREVVNVVEYSKGEEKVIGIEGHLLPFALVQEDLLAEDLQEIRNRENRLAEISECYQQIIESFTPEELDKPILNDDNTKFVAKEVKREVKEILNTVNSPEIETLRGYPSRKGEKLQYVLDHPEIPWRFVKTDELGIYSKKQINELIANVLEAYSFGEDSYEEKLREVARLLDEEKNLISELKERLQKLELDTIDTIHGIDNDAATELLRTKWTQPLTASLARMPEEVINNLTERINQLTTKYATTYKDISKRINAAEKQLYSLLGELQGTAADNSGLSELRETLNTAN